MINPDNKHLGFFDQARRELAATPRWQLCVSVREKLDVTSPVRTQPAPDSGKVISLLPYLQLPYLQLTRPE